MTDYTKFYTAKHITPDELPKSEEELRKETELAEYKALIQQLGYARFDD